jgi:tetraacyldisaccharide 4'-kinase
MMARIFGLTVAVGKSRYQAAAEILKAGAVDVFLLDDGFQHRQLARDVDLLLLGSDFEGWMLPAGPFREPKAALGRADCLLVTDARDAWQRVVGKNHRQPVFYGSLQPQALVALESDRWREHSLGRLAQRKVLAVMGIANPEPFCRMIELSKGQIVETMAFPDHHHYTAKDRRRIARAAGNVDLVVTTEKDILKLVGFSFAGKELLALRVAMIVDSGAVLIQSMVERIQNKQFSHRIWG